MTEHKRFVRRHELARISGVKAETINKYSDLGLLAFRQDGAGTPRYYDTKTAVMRLSQIALFKNDGYSLDMIKKRLGKK